MTFQIFVTMNEYVMVKEVFENGDVVRDLKRPPRPLPPPQRSVETRLSDFSFSLGLRLIGRTVT